ncbi:glycoside hydrolase family 15 protein [Streptomyces polygonati]|uniref:Glycoside hydrolase family 15 protein n=1 Tax=Streptomyces polygonati TaxID=1617087 RepID=A0ABV8HY50_9ACTN
MDRRIEDYAFIGDMQTAALVHRDGSVDWLCLPTFDSPSVFSGLLGTDAHGMWRIAPVGQALPRSRRYRGDTVILETEWVTSTGTVRITEFMPPRPAEAPGVPQLIRIVRGVRGTVEMSSTMRLVFGYGQVIPRRTRFQRPFGLARGLAVAGPDAVWSDSSVETFDAPDGTTRADFTIREGETAEFALTWQHSHLPAPPAPDPHQALADADAYWTGWASRCTYTGQHTEAVIRALVTLKALTYASTGAVVAAPTTSLPEEVGGERNWDYRFGWLRDAAITLACFLRTGYREEAGAWREWLLRAVAGDPQQLQIMYSITGQRDLPEREIDLPGYADSRPVRVGNAAAGQLQIDVYGEVIDTLHLGHLTGLDFHDDAHQLQLELLRHLEKVWRDPDDGIWEVRGPRRHFVHSKVMAWVAVDRLVQLIESGDAAGPLEHLTDLRAEIHRDVCENGYDTERNTFTQSYGSSELDASLLLIPQTGFLPPTDKRVIGTIEAIQRELSTEDGFVLRYPTAGSSAGVDGLLGDEGAFLACSFWMVEALVMIGRLDEADRLFDKLLGLRNDLGLLAEEWDSHHQRQVGNFPQAFSLFALVLAALRLAAPPVAAGVPRDDALVLDTGYVR